MSAVLPRSPRTHTALVCVTLSLVMLVLCWPAFDGYFASEDFTHWGSYVAAGRSVVGGALSAHGYIFFRPTSKALTILINLVLPPSPFLYHLRNWLCSCLCLVLFYLLALRLTGSPSGALAGCAMLAVSKINLTTIGYLLVFDSIFCLAASLASLLLLLAYFEDRKRWQITGHYVCFAVAVGARDYGLGLIVPVLAAWWVQERTLRLTIQKSARSCAVYAVSIALCLLARSRVVAIAPSDPQSPYAISFAPRRIFWRAWVAFSTMFNISVDQPNVTGRGSFASAPGIPAWAHTPLEIAFLAICAAFTVWMIAGPLWRDRRVLIALGWLLTFLLPSLLISNINVYYILEPLAGFALLVAIAFANPLFRARAAPLWIAILVVSSVSAVANSRNVSVFNWRYCADAAKRVYDVVSPLAGNLEVKRLRFVTASPEQTTFWAFTLASGPMLPYLLRNPELEVRIDSGDQHFEPVPGERLYIQSGETFITRRLPPVIVRLVPSSTVMGQSFNPQPDGSSAIWIDCNEATTFTIIYWAGHRLETAHGGPTALSAIVPRELYRDSGSADIELRDELFNVVSNAMRFEVRKR